MKALWSQCCLLVIIAVGTSNAFNIPKLGDFFKPPSPMQEEQSFPVAEKKAQLLEAISFTANGKNALPDLQKRVLAMVAELEENCPVSDTLLSNPSEGRALDGTWYLQYTSPSVIDDGDPVSVSVSQVVVRNIRCVSAFCFLSTNTLLLTRCLRILGNHKLRQKAHPTLIPNKSTTKEHSLRLGYLKLTRRIA